ncbi:FecCD family ABC transporter permease [Oceanobacter mangrovi]|uniref:FecCD family ABC transporter permease n=1 Tax=Oceanobacter mangrovi TaxID=2862510 RepID=UPI001C8D464E|nr:iron ABC transporter permease [Oceanobacter mangrovi]
MTVRTLPRLFYWQTPKLSWLPLLLLLTISAALLALTLGPYPVSVADISHWIAGRLLGMATAINSEAGWLERMDTLLIEIRLPRILAALLIGAALASSGAAYQAVFVNPLVSPGILGVLAGASFGAALGLVSSDSWMLIQLMTVIGGVTAVAVGLGIGRMFGNQSVIMLVLGGIFSGALFSGLLALVKFSADPYEQLPAIVYWLMGALGQASLDDMKLYGPILLVCIGGLAMLGRALDALTLGDDSAAALGIPVARIRLLVIMLATVASALTVSLAGMIGWVGLLAPHIARLLVGPLNRILIPASALIGALFLLAADALARSLTQSEIPIGVITELVGLPVFLLVLRRANRGWR